MTSMMDIGNNKFSISSSTDIKETISDELKANHLFSSYVSISERLNNPNSNKNTIKGSKNFLVSTYNVCTLYQPGKFHQLCNGCFKVNIDFAAIQEHRWITNLCIDQQWDVDHHYLFIYSSADHNRVGGVGLLIKEKYACSIKNIDNVSSRILKITFNCNPELTIVSAYAPTETASQITKQSFYNDLEACITNIPKHNITIVAGDFNARIGIDSHHLSPRVIGKHTYHLNTNDNGNKLTAFCESADLRPIQTKFPHPDKRVWTWEHRGTGKKAQLDHLLINGKWYNSTRNCRSYSTVDLDSDHRITTAAINLSLRCNKKKPNGPPRYNWRSLLTNKETQKRYTIEISNKYEILYDLDNMYSTQDKYDTFTKCVKEANEITLNKVETTKNTWVTPETERLCEIKNKARLAYDKTKTKSAHNKWKLLIDKTKRAFKKDKENYYKKLANKATEANKTNNIKETYRIINSIAGKYRKNIAKYAKKCKNTSEIKSDKIAEEWKEYFKELLNNDTNKTTPSIEKRISVELPINTEDITAEEIKLALKYLGNGKATGIDRDITSEALKYGGEKIIDMLLDICNDVYKNNMPPKQWTTNIIIPVPKNGCSNIMSNFRGIS